MIRQTFPYQPFPLNVSPTIISLSFACRSFAHAPFVKIFPVKPLHYIYSS